MRLILFFLNYLMKVCQKNYHFKTFVVFKTYLNIFWFKNKKFKHSATPTFTVRIFFKHATCLDYFFK